MTKKQRLMQAVTFEITALTLFILVFAPLFNKSITDMGSLGIFLSLLTVAILYFYNPLFDKALLKYTGSVDKNINARLVHALLFELSLVLLALPLLAWWLNMSFLNALILEVAAVTFMTVYTFVFHWLVDLIILKKPA